MANFNLNKGAEAEKKDRFSLDKSAEPAPAPEKKERFSLDKAEDATIISEKSYHFSLDKAEDATIMSDGTDRSRLDHARTTSSEQEKTPSNPGKGDEEITTLGSNVGTGSSKSSDNDQSRETATPAPTGNDNPSSVAKKKNLWWVAILILFVALLLLFLLTKKSNKPVGDDAGITGVIATQPGENQGSTKRNNLNGSDGQTVSDGGKTEPISDEILPPSDPNAPLQNNKTPRSEPTKAPGGTATPDNGKAEPRQAGEKTVKPIMMPPSEIASSSVEKLAKRAIKGDLGNGRARREALGDRYGEVQEMINQMYRERKLGRRQ